MPWKVYHEKKDGKDQYCLHKHTNGVKGELVPGGCHDTPEEARKHQSALYVSENKEFDPFDLVIVEEEPETDKDLTSPDLPAGISTSFEELYAQRDYMERTRELDELMADFQMLVGNVIYTPESLLEEDKVKALSSLFEEFKGLVDETLNTPSDETKARREDVSAADRKRAVDKYGDVNYADEENKKYPIDTRAHIIAAEHYIGMPRNASKYTPEKLASIKSKIASARKKIIGNKKKGILDKAVEAVKDVLEPPKSDVLVWKEADGIYSWVTSYSNKFMDRDNPPDIIASDAHQKFIDKVDKKEAPLPDLELWHIPEWKIGYTTAMAYDDSGFPIAIGRFDDNKEAQEVAEFLAKQTDFGVSHGMYNRTIRRDPEDESVIIAYETHEISPLPRKNAANLLADWYVIENEIKEVEDDMAIPEEKRQELLKRGLPESTLAALEERNKVKAETATAEGVKSKETEETETQPVPEEKVETEEKTPEKKEEVSEFPTRQEVAEAVTNVVAPLFEELGKQIVEINKQLDENRKALEEFQTSDEKRIKEIISMTPRDSLSTIMAARLTERASSSKQTKIGEKDNLMEKKPREEKEETPSRFGINFIDKLVSDGK